MTDHRDDIRPTIAVAFSRFLFALAIVVLIVVGLGVGAVVALIAAVFLGWVPLC